MYLLYTVIFFCITPIILMRLLWRSFKAPEYRRRWTERFAFYSTKRTEGVIWLHAVSVGEAKASFPLIKALQAHYPGSLVLVTTTTPTGSKIVRQQFDETVCHVYLPYDLPYCVNRFYDQFKPRLAIFMETEIWPNYYRIAGEREISLLIVNARLSEKSLRGYQKLRGFFSNVLSNITLIATQTDVDSERFLALGVSVEKVKHVGNIKFDVELPNKILEKGKTVKEILFLNRPVWIVASTHDGEEKILLNLLSKLKIAFPSILMVIVPRHPERFSKVAQLVGASANRFVLRSEDKPCDKATAVFIVDTMGELNLFYAACDIAFVGGSLVSVGGHNVLEPAFLGKPIIFGPYVKNFSDITSQLLKYDAAIQCQNSDQLLEIMMSLLSNETRQSQLGENAKKFVKKNQGTVDKLIRIVAEFI